MASLPGSSPYRPLRLADQVHNYAYPAYTENFRFCRVAGGPAAAGRVVSLCGCAGRRHRSQGSPGGSHCIAIEGPAWPWSRKPSRW
jgi:hypothetical protein